MNWLRLYEDMPLDPKLRTFTPTEKWVWVCLLCAVARCDQRGCYVLAPSLPGSSSDLAADANVRLVHAESALRKAIKYGLVDYADGVYRVVKWDKRQFKSDVSTGRVRAHRERSRNVAGTDQKQKQRTETDTEEKKPPQLANRPACFSEEVLGVVVRLAAERYGESWVMKATNLGTLYAKIGGGCVPDCPGDDDRAKSCANHFCDVMERKKNVGHALYAIANDPRPWAEVKR